MCALVHSLTYTDMKEHVYTQTRKLGNRLRGYSCLQHPDVDGCPWLLILNLH